MAPAPGEEQPLECPSFVNWICLGDIKESQLCGPGTAFDGEKCVESQVPLSISPGDDTGLCEQTTWLGFFPTGCRRKALTDERIAHYCPPGGVTDDYGRCLPKPPEPEPESEPPKEPVRCSEYTCQTQGWVNKDDAAEIVTVNPGDGACCRPNNCSFMTCPDGYDGKPNPEANTGAPSVDRCCVQKKCMTYTCPTGWQKKAGADEQFGHTTGECCEQKTCALVSDQCEGQTESASSNRLLTSIDRPELQKDLSSCCRLKKCSDEPEAACAAGFYRKDTAGERVRVDEYRVDTETFNANCCARDSCDAVTCRAHDQRKKENGSAREGTCCETNCSAHECPAGSELRNDPANIWGIDDAAASIEMCCRVDANNKANAVDAALGDMSGSAQQFADAMCSGVLAPGQNPGQTMAERFGTKEAALEKLEAFSVCGAEHRPISITYFHSSFNVPWTRHLTLAQVRAVYGGDTLPLTDRGNELAYNRDTFSYDHTVLELGNIVEVPMGLCVTLSDPYDSSEHTICGAGTDAQRWTSSALSFDDGNTYVNKFQAVHDPKDFHEAYGEAMPFVTGAPPNYTYKTLKDLGYTKMKIKTNSDGPACGQQVYTTHSERAGQSNRLRRYQQTDWNSEWGESRQNAPVMGYNIKDPWMPGNCLPNRYTATTNGWKLGPPVPFPIGTGWNKPSVRVGADYWNSDELEAIRVKVLSEGKNPEFDNEDDAYNWCLASPTCDGIVRNAERTSYTPRTSSCRIAGDDVYAHWVHGPDLTHAGSHWQNATWGHGSPITLDGGRCNADFTPKPLLGIHNRSSRWNTCDDGGEWIEATWHYPHHGNHTAFIKRSDPLEPHQMQCPS